MSAPAGIEPARTLAPFLPPLPPPQGLRGSEAIARVVVDSAGRVVADSISLCGIADMAYATRVVQRIAEIPFAAAMENGVKVQRAITLSYQF